MPGFVFTFNGYIEVTSEMDTDTASPAIDILFALGSDDGSRLLVAGNTVVDNGGEHPFGSQVGFASFESAGLYPVDIIYYNNTFGGGLEWSSSIPGGALSGGPAGAEAILPPSVLYSQIPSTQTCDLDLVLDLDGTDAHVLIPDSASLDGMADLTVEAEASIRSFGDTVDVATKWKSELSGEGSWMLGATPDGRPFFTVSGDGNNGTTVTSSQAMILDECHHIAGVYSSSLESLWVYLDGQLVGSSGSVTEGSVFDSDSKVLIGAVDHTGATREADAEIDEVRIWNRELPAASIQQNLGVALDSAYFATTDSGLVGYWRFDCSADLGIGGDGTDDVMDLSVQGNHGDLESDARLWPGTCNNSTFPCTPLLGSYPCMATSEFLINNATPALAGSLQTEDVFGTSVASLGDLNGDLYPELAVGAKDFDGTGTKQGAIWILFSDSLGGVESARRISNGTSGLLLDDGDRFGTSVAALGDLDSNGVIDIAVGSPHHNNEGAIWVVYLDSLGSADSLKKLTGPGTPNSAFGRSVCSLGDLDEAGPGALTLAVGADSETMAGSPSGAVYILTLNGMEDTISTKRIGANAGIPAGELDANDEFGWAVTHVAGHAPLGQATLAVSAVNDDDGAFSNSGFERGAVWLLTLDSTATVVAYQKVSDSEGQSELDLNDLDGFGYSLASLGDFDGDGLHDVAVGAIRDCDGGNQHGAVYVFSIDTTGIAVDFRKISDTHGGFDGALDDKDRFGRSIALLGDLDSNGVVDIAVGASGDDGTSGSPSENYGGVWILGLADSCLIQPPDPCDLPSPVESFTKIDNRALQSLPEQISDTDAFGSAVTSVGDLDGNGVTDLAIGLPGFSIEPALSWGAVWIVFRDSLGAVTSVTPITDGEGGFSSGILEDNASLGKSVANLGDWNGDGFPELGVGAPVMDGGQGRMFVLYLNGTGAADSSKMYGGNLGGFPDSLDPTDEFGSSIAALGDLDGNGIAEIAVGAQNSDASRGSIWIVFPTDSGTVGSATEIGNGMGGVSLDVGDVFGSNLASLGDLDGDGTWELAVGAPDDDDLPTNSGAVWILSIDSTGSAQSSQKISATQGGLPAGILEPADHFGSSISAIDDLNDDGVPDMIVGAPLDDLGEPTNPNADRGAVWILLMNTDGTVNGVSKIGDGLNGFPEDSLETQDWFGASVASVGDLNGDGIVDLAVGASRDDDSTATNSGAVWILELNALCAIATTVSGPDDEAGGSVPWATAKRLQIRPNPANPSIQLRFTMERKERVSLSIYDIRGREIKRLLDGVLDAGSHETTWNGSGHDGRTVSSGIYFAVVQKGADREVSKFVILK